VVHAGGGSPPEGQLIGHSREGRPIHGFRFGRGPLRLSLIAGCHADEPVGPALLGRLAGYLAGLPEGAPELAGATWYLVPHTNPDGEARNHPWTAMTEPAEDHRGGEDRVYDPVSHLGHMVRELPGDDMEFGFPAETEEAGLRPENRAVADFLRGGAPFHLHASLHGMAYGFGPWFLLEPQWIERTGDLRRSLSGRVAEMGYLLHDVDRKGAKGFWRIAPGFGTRPDSRAMRSFFLERGEPEVAERFRPTSMEFVRGLGNDPLTLVSEMPLFLLCESGAGDDDPPLPVDSDSKKRFALWFQKLAAGASEAEQRRQLQRLGIRPMPIRDQMRLQLALLEEGVRAVAGELEVKAR
jgi:hypothetical protein